VAYRGKELLSDGVHPIFIEKLILLIRLRNGEGGSNKSKITKLKKNHTPTTVTFQDVPAKQHLSCDAGANAPVARP